MADLRPLKCNLPLFMFYLKGMTTDRVALYNMYVFFGIHKSSMYIIPYNCIICMYGAGSGDGFSGKEDHIPVTGNVPAGSDKGLLNTSCVLMELPQLPFPKIAYRRSVVQSPTAVYARRVRTVQRHQESHVVMPTKIYSYVGYLLYITVYVCAIIYVASPERLYVFQYL